MDWRGGTLLAGRITRALYRIAADRLAEARGAALPRTPEQAATPAAIQAILRDAGAGTPRRVVRASLPGVDFESSNCRNFLIAVEWDGPVSSDRPATLYCKLPCPETGTRAFANAVGFWAVECAFARNLAHRVPIRVPRVHGVAERGARFVLLCENLLEEPGTRLFTNRDMAAGTGLERARLCLETFAELHAGFWNLDAASRERLLPRRLHTYLAPGGKRLTRALGDFAVGPAQRAAPEIFGSAHAALCRRTLARWDEVIASWYSGPTTLIHGDSHLANCFEYRRDGGRRIGLLDFQGLQWCHGIRDVQYFCINSLAPELLAVHEADLIRHYCDALAQHGVALGFEAAFERYRAYSFQTLMVAVTSLGLASLTERSETLETVLARSVAASDRLDFGGWLERL